MGMADPGDGEPWGQRTLGMADWNCFYPLQLIHNHEVQYLSVNLTQYFILQFKLPLPISFPPIHNQLFLPDSHIWFITWFNIHISTK